MCVGKLFEELCALVDVGKKHQLVDYQAHRFMGLTSVIERILELWPALERWYDDQNLSARQLREKLPDPFPLEDDKVNLEQHLSLLKPITVLNQKSQGESARQVECLLYLYRLRLSSLDVSKPLKDYRSTRETPKFIDIKEMTPELKKTRSLLAAQFEKNFFIR